MGLALAKLAAEKAVVWSNTFQSDTIIKAAEKELASKLALPGVMVTWMLFMYDPAYPCSVILFVSTYGLDEMMTLAASLKVGLGDMGLGSMFK